MDKIETQELIKAAGGDTAFARLLGIDGQKGCQQRVNNWKRRGIPSSVILDHLETIQRLRSASQPKAA